MALFQVLSLVAELQFCVVSSSVLAGASALSIIAIILVALFSLVAVVRRVAVVGGWFAHGTSDVSAPNDA